MSAAVTSTARPDSIDDELGHHRLLYVLILLTDTHDWSRRVLMGIRLDLHLVPPGCQLWEMAVSELTLTGSRSVKADRVGPDLKSVGWLMSRSSTVSYQASFILSGHD